MSPAEFLTEIRQRGAVLRLEGDQIRCRAPQGVMTEKTPRYMRRHKDALVALLAAEAATDPDGLLLRSAITLFDGELVGDMTVGDRSPQAGDENTGVLA